MVNCAFEAAEQLIKEQISLKVVGSRTLNSLDLETLVFIAGKTHQVEVAELLALQQ